VKASISYQLLQLIRHRLRSVGVKNNLMGKFSGISSQLDNLRKHCRELVDNQNPG
jgi:hypothetical protein